MARTRGYVLAVLASIVILFMSTQIPRTNSYASGQYSGKNVTAAEIDSLLGTNNYIMGVRYPMEPFGSNGLAGNMSEETFVNVDNGSDYSVPAVVTISILRFGNASAASDYVRAYSVNNSLDTYNIDTSQYYGTVQLNPPLQNVTVNTYSIYSVGATTPTLLVYNVSRYQNLVMPLFQYSTMASHGQYVVLVSAVGYTSTLNPNASIDVFRLVMDKLIG